MTFRASSLVAVVIAATANVSNLRSSASSFTRRRTAMMSSSVSSFIAWFARTSIIGSPALELGDDVAEELEAVVEVQRGAHPLHRVSHSNERGGDLGAHADEHRVGAHQLRHPS